MFEKEFEKFLSIQKQSATGHRLELLNRRLTGEKKMLEVVIWPVLQSFDGVTMEYELTSLAGNKIYIDAFYAPLGLAFESEGFASHAETITRDRFSFEKLRARTLAAYRYPYVPFSKDELDGNGEACRRSLYEIFGRYSSVAGSRAMEELSVYEREVLRYMLRLNRNLKLVDVKYVLQCGYVCLRRVIEQLIIKNMIKPVGSGSQRFHEYELLSLGREIILFG